MKSIVELEQEYADYMYMASGLRYSHQQTMKNALINKADSIKEEIEERKTLLCEQYKQLMIMLVL